MGCFAELPITALQNLQIYLFTDIGAFCLHMVPLFSFALSKCDKVARIGPLTGQTRLLSVSRGSA
jgi:hypothetical protein